MKKFYLAIVTLLVAVCSVSAQTTLIATLSHEGNLEMFYGTSALREAYNAATDGDVITLSPGSFDGVGIQKAITLRGAGMGVDDGSKYSIPTIINSGFRISNPQTDNPLKVCIEGIHMNDVEILTSVDFIKCWIDRPKYTGSYAYYDYGSVNFINCIIKDSPRLESYRDFVFLNCIILNMSTPGSSSIKSVFTNCFVEFRSSSTNYEIFGSTFTNCIICMSEASEREAQLRSNTTDSSYAYFCLFYKQKGTASFNPTPNGTNVERLDLDTPFTTEGFYNLKDEFKNFTTSDGTELGIYGGNMSFSQTPNAPQITKFAVAPKTSADGKLSIELEVQVAE